jgi:hypothetical protein
MISDGEMLQLQQQKQIETSNYRLTTGDGAIHMRDTSLASAEDPLPPTTDASRSQDEDHQGTFAPPVRQGAQLQRQPEPGPGCASSAPYHDHPHAHEESAARQSSQLHEDSSRAATGIHRLRCKKNSLQFRAISAVEADEENVKKLIPRHSRSTPDKD